MAGSRVKNTGAVTWAERHFPHASCSLRERHQVSQSICARGICAWVGCGRGSPRRQWVGDHKRPLTRITLISVDPAKNL